MGFKIKKPTQRKAHMKECWAYQLRDGLEQDTRNFKNFEFFFLRINFFLVFLNYFDALISKIIFKK